MFPNIMRLICEFAVNNAVYADDDKNGEHYWYVQSKHTGN
jgi:hypothetical protein